MKTSELSPLKLQNSTQGIVLMSDCGCFASKKVGVVCMQEKVTGTLRVLVQISTCEE